MVDQLPEAYAAGTNEHHRARATVELEKATVEGLARFKLGTVDGHFLGERNELGTVPDGYGIWAASPRVVFADTTPYGSKTHDEYPQSGYVHVCPAVRLWEGGSACWGVRERKREREGEGEEKRESCPATSKLNIIQCGRFIASLVCACVLCLKLRIW